MESDQDTLCLVAECVIDQHIPITLSYVVPKNLKDLAKVGSRCQVPLRDKSVKGFILSLKEQEASLSLKEIEEILTHVEIQPKLLELALWMSRYYVTSLSRVLHFFVPKVIKEKAYEKTYTHAFFEKNALDLISSYLKEHHPRKKKAQSFIETLDAENTTHTISDLKKQLSLPLYEMFCQKGWIIQKEIDFEDDFDPIISQKKILTDEQAFCARSIISHLNHTFSCHLIFGVCGSGKTEVYFEVMEACLKQNKSIIYLIPEVSLAPQTILRIKRRFHEKVALFHHKISDGIKAKDWEELKEGKTSIVVGARSAIFAPMKNLGLVIIDEEHEGAYKQESMPTYHTKDVALMRCKFENAMLLLGSATPSIESFHYAKEGKITLHTLKNRPSHATLPEIFLTSLQTEFIKAQGFHLFSEKALKELEINFKRGEQSLIFINRRGYHSQQMCSSCHEPIVCHQCSIPLTFHKNDNALICHYCGFSTPAKQECPSCKSPTLKFKGYGTQLVETKLNQIFQEAKILRIDKDTTSKKDALENLIDTFSSKGADILIGTQMIAKGLDFSHLTLAIIVNMDSLIHRPDFRAHEQAFQLMTQVAGRAGRSDLKGQVIIQTLSPELPIFQKAQNQDYESFFNEEIQVRQSFDYPPFSRLTRFVFSAKDLPKLENYAKTFRQKLIEKCSSNITIEPVISCFHEKIEGEYRLHMLIKSKQAIKLYQILEEIDKSFRLAFGIKRVIDVDPQSTYF